MAPQRGLTLLEMLIALVILSSVMSIASTAYSYYATGFNERGDRFNEQLQALKKQTIWQDQLASAFYYYVEVLPNNFRPYFMGSEKDISWMTANSLLEPGKVARSWLGLQEGMLTYCEQSLTQKLVKTLEYSAEEICSGYRLPVRGAESINVQYYSWPSLLDWHLSQSDERPVATERQPQWASRHHSGEKELLPIWARIELSDKDNEKQTIWVRLENFDVYRLQVFSGSSNG
jgi:prepilin-type N-terminal cleavage/methylation domain-containing protein